MSNSNMWLWIKLKSGEAFVAMANKEDQFTVVVTQVVQPYFNSNTGTWRIALLTSMRLINRAEIVYRDVIDELVNVDAEYQEQDEMPWYFTPDRVGI